MSEINVLPSTPSTVVIDDDEATTSGISICTSVSGSYNSGDCGDGVCEYDENGKDMLDEDDRKKRQRRQSNCCNAAELEKLTPNLEQQQQQLNNQKLSIPSHSQIPQTASSSTILNATPSAATIASVIQLKKTNLLSTYLRRIFHHCKVN